MSEDDKRNPWLLHGRPSSTAAVERSGEDTPPLQDSGERTTLPPEDAGSVEREIEGKLDNPEESVCLTAYNLVRGPRRGTYGHPLGDYARVGRMWGAILDGWLRKLGYVDDNEELPAVPPELACLMMQAIKISREVNAPKRDNRVDGCGYWDCLQLIVEEQERRKP